MTVSGYFCMKHAQQFYTSFGSNGSALYTYILHITMQNLQKTKTKTKQQLAASTIGREMFYLHYCM